MFLNNNIKNQPLFYIDRNVRMSSFMKVLRDNPPMTPEEERVKFEEYERTKDPAIREEIINRYQRFVYAVAKRFTTDENIMDVVSEGNIGIINAFDTFDYKTGNRFYTYAIWYMRKEISDFFAKNSIVKRTNGRKIANKVNKLKGKFFAIHGRYPSYDELKEMFQDEYGIKVVNEGDLYELVCKSIDGKIGGDDDDLDFGDSSEYNEATATENGFVDTERKDYVHKTITKYLSGLTEKERDIVKMFYGIGYTEPSTMERIGEKYGLTGERTRQIFSRSLRKMRSKKLSAKY